MVYFSLQITIKSSHCLNRKKEEKKRDGGSGGGGGQLSGVKTTVFTETMKKRAREQEEALFGTKQRYQWKQRLQTLALNIT